MLTRTMLLAQMAAQIMAGRYAGSAGEQHYDTSLGACIDTAEKLLEQVEQRTKNEVANTDYSFVRTAEEPV